MAKIKDLKSSAIGFLGCQTPLKHNLNFNSPFKNVYFSYKYDMTQTPTTFTLTRDSEVAWTLASAFLKRTFIVKNHWEAFTK